MQKIASFAPFALGLRGFKKVPLNPHFPIYNNVIVVYNATQFIEGYEEGLFSRVEVFQSTLQVIAMNC